MTGHVYESPAFVRLFQAYTGSGDSIGARLASVAERRNSDAPMIVATASDLALYPGGGRPPQVEGFRLSTRGFRELTAISHLGPAVASLARLKETDPHSEWKANADELLEAARETRLANSPELWADQIRVGTFVGREKAISEMVDYACRVTERYLDRAVNEPTYLSPETVRRDYLDGPSDDLPVPVNRIMVATFFLFGMDLAHRLINWFDGLDLPWEQTMVIIAGRQGRPTAGVTRDSNSVAAVIHASSRGRLPEHRLLIAPHAAVFPMYDGSNITAVAELEPDYRRLWAGVRETCLLGEQMFSGYAGYDPSRSEGRGELPSISGSDDWFAMTSRLRVVLEDPRQLLSGAVTDYAAHQLIEHDNDPSQLIVPGLDGEPYHPSARAFAAAVADGATTEGEAS